MHSSLRSINFWRLILINLLVSTFVYMSMPLWPSMLEAKGEGAFEESSSAMLLFCIGMLLPGCVSSYLLDKYPRKMVCFWSVILLACSSIVVSQDLSLGVIAACRLVQGIMFMLFHIALGNTILIDITISERRDVASYIYFWICRFALAVGPALGIIALKPEYWEYFQYLPIFCGVAAIYLMARMDVPFRTPLENNVFSLDRFWLLGSYPLVIILFPVPLCLGVEMVFNMNPLFYLYLLLGFFLSMVLHFVVFYRADVRAEIVTGYMALIASFLILLTQKDSHIMLVASTLSGYGVGNVSGRLMSFFTATSRHADRGSAQGTYKLTFECALCIGFFLPCLLCGASANVFYAVSICLCALALFLYLSLVHGWFMKNIKR